MIINVRMLAFHDNIIRPVDVPDSQVINNKDGVMGFLVLVYHYGQNDFVQGQNADTIRRSICSVSVGDVIELPDCGNYMVTQFGFKRLDETEYAAYKAIPTHRDRSYHAYMLQGDNL